MVERTAETATLRQKLAALAEADKDNALKRLTSTPDDRRERRAALLRDMNNPSSV